jgi:aspartyl-tRNA(Asn)/glutamyl-tRNA(Gln) amidotransferase subunit C
VVEPSLSQEEALSQAPKAVEGRFAVPRILGEPE